MHAPVDAGIRCLGGGPGCFGVEVVALPAQVSVDFEAAWRLKRVKVDFCVYSGYVLLIYNKDIYVVNKFVLYTLIV